MVWLLALPIIYLAAAVFSRRFEQYLEQLTGPWIISGPAKTVHDEVSGRG
jgi:hypothetical protein